MAFRLSLSSLAQLSRPAKLATAAVAVVVLGGSVYGALQLRDAAALDSASRNTISKIDKAGSLSHDDVTTHKSADKLVIEASNKDTPITVGDTSVTPAPVVPVNGMAPGLYSGTPRAGNDVVIRLYENSGTDAVNAVQAKIGYDPSQLEFIRAEQTNPYAIAAATDTQTPGVVRLARATGAATTTGTQSVVAIAFKIKANVKGTVTINLDKNETFIVRSPDAKNILQIVEPLHIIVKD